jgi:signal transduction histidine kinase
MAVAGKYREKSVLKTTSDPAWLNLRRAFLEINTEKEFGPMTTTILRQACRMFQAGGAALLLANKLTGMLEIAAVQNISAEALEAYRMQPESTLALESPGQEEDSSGALNRIRSLGAGFPQQVILPIQLQNKIIGCLILAAAHFLENSKDRQERLEIFLEYMAQAIENAYLIFQLRQQNSNLEMMMTRLQNTQNHLKRAEKMALVGKIATAVAHEMRNPLTIISTTLQLVYEKMPAGHSDRELYAAMIGKVRTVDQTIKELMNFARPVQIQLKSVKLSEVIARVATFIGKKYAGHKLELQVEVSPELPAIYVDEEQLQRILINLFLNAYNFLPEGGTVRLAASHAEKSPWLDFSFSDNGPGISPEHAQQIFEPFFSTRTDGTGLGLFLVKHLLEEMNGSIEVNSAASQGAEFRIKLPLEA